MQKAFLSLLILITSFSVKAGPITSGGGDSYIVDFMQTATQVIYPWLQKYGQTLSPQISTSDFLIAINPKDIEVQEHVFESCNGSTQGREVEACYNNNIGKIYLSRSLYPINSDIYLPSKVGLVAHEVFRKLGVEGDQYEVTKQMAIAHIAESGTYIFSKTLDLSQYGEDDRPIINTQVAVLETDCATSLKREIKAKVDQGFEIFYLEECQSKYWSNSNNLIFKVETKASFSYMKK